MVESGIIAEVEEGRPWRGGRRGRGVRSIYLSPSGSVKALMAHGKDRHYWTQLRAALTAGVWSSSAPAKTPNNHFLSWSELIRKFNKHCTGFQDVAEIAAQTQVLSLWLSADAVDEDQLGSEPDGQLCLASECILLPERVQEATAGYQALKKLQGTRSDVRSPSLSFITHSVSSVSPLCPRLLRVRVWRAVRLSRLPV